MDNTNFALTLAIKGKEQQLKDLAVKMVEMGYIHKQDKQTNDIACICTNWCGYGISRFGFNQVPNDRTEISFDTHSYECILALLSARKYGEEFQSGELVIGNNSGAIYSVLKGAFYDKANFTRPTFDQIVAHFAPKQDLVTITVNADEWKALNEEIATLKDYNKFLLDANRGLRDLTLELEAKNATLTKQNAHIAELVHQLKPIETEWIPFDADKWSGKLEDIRDFSHESLLYAKIEGDYVTIVYSTNAPSEILLRNAQNVLSIRNPRYINPPITC
jgi:hypothetical protein